MVFGVLQEIRDGRAIQSGTHVMEFLAELYLLIVCQEHRNDDASLYRLHPLCHVIIGVKNVA